MPETNTQSDAKKILLVLPGLGYGGAERVGSELANAFAALGCQTLLVTMDDGAQDFFTLTEPAQLLHLDLSTPSKHFGQAIWRNWQRVRRLRQLFKVQQPDCIIGFTARVNVLCALASRGLPSRVILSERTHPPGMPLGRAWEALRRRAYGRADVVVAQTQVAADWLRHNTSANRVDVIPNGISNSIDTPTQHVDPNQLVQPQQRLLLAIGRLVSEKAFNRLIQAMQALAPGNPDWQLVILGEGPLRAELKAASQSLPVQLPGVAGNLSQWYARADLFALSSIVEGFPNSLLEALAHGCPVVATDCDAGPRDLVNHEVNGLLVSNSQDPAELTAALQRLMTDAPLRQQLASNARASVQHLQQARVLKLWQALVEGAS